MSYYPVYFILANAYGLVRFEFDSDAMPCKAIVDTCVIKGFENDVLHAMAGVSAISIEDIKDAIQQAVSEADAIEA